MTTTEVKPADATGTEATGTETTYKLNKTNIEQIKRWDLEADGHMGEADQFRAQAAGLIVAELDAGATQRQVAEAIGKTPAHVAHAAKAWRMMQDDDFTVPEGKERFNTAYNRAKSPKPPVEDTQDAAQEGGSADSGSAETPFPAWAKQLREFNRLAAEMIEQATPPQIKQFNKTIQKFFQAGVAKEDEFNASPGQS